MVLEIENILRLTQEELLDFNYNELLKRNYKDKDITYTEDYVYAKGNIPVLLVAHCDIVHKQIPTTIVYDKEKQILWSPTGIGGDDRCGVYGVLKICEKFKPYVLFTTDEEIGGVGVKKFVKDFDEIPVNFIIELDRRGYNQVVFYECGNKEFQNYILSFGLDKYIGSYSDVSTLSTEYDIAGCNISAGYYNEHTNVEYIVMDELQHSIDIVKEILKDTKNHKFYDCQKVTYSRFGNWYNNVYDYDNYYYDDYWGCYRLKKKQDKKVKEIEEQESKTKEIEEELYTEEIPLTEEEQKEVNRILQMEDDYFALTPEEWKKKYKRTKPKNIVDIY